MRPIVVFLRYGDGVPFEIVLANVVKVGLIPLEAKFRLEPRVPRRSQASRLRLLINNFTFAITRALVWVANNFKVLVRLILISLIDAGIARFKIFLDQGSL